MLAALAALPGRAVAADCAAPGVPGQFDVFALHVHGQHGRRDIPGRVAAGGNARIQSITLGTSRR